MNKKQKIIAVIGLAVFAATLLWAPWTVTRTSAYNTLTYSSADPIWSGPANGELRIGTILVEWAAIGIFAGSLMIIFRDKH